MVKFITMTFPEIQIKPNSRGTKYVGDDEGDESDMDEASDSESDDDQMTAYGVHDREEYPGVIDVNGGLFDCIEEFQRTGRPYGHLLYHTFIVIAHEMGHYLNTCVRIFYRFLALEDPN